MGGSFIKLQLLLRWIFEVLIDGFGLMIAWLCLLAYRSVGLAGSQSESERRRDSRSVGCVTYLCSACWVL